MRASALTLANAETVISAPSSLAVSIHAPIVLALLFLSTVLQAANPTTSGEFAAERPTLVPLGFEWHIDGDDNHNAAVSVFYRKKGEQTVPTRMSASATCVVPFCALALLSG